VRSRHRQLSARLCSVHTRKRCSACVATLWLTAGGAPGPSCRLRSRQSEGKETALLNKEEIGGGQEGMYPTRPHVLLAARQEVPPAHPAGGPCAQATNTAVSNRLAGCKGWAAFGISW
jgi:hypothetical protein